MRALIGSLVGMAIWFSAASAQDRVVTLGGDVTEIVYALGSGDRVVGTDDNSIHPANAASKPKVGYLRRLSAEGVLSLEPDLVLISGAAGPEAAISQIEASGVRVVSMDTDYSPEAVLQKVEVIAGALGLEEEGEEYRDRMEEAFGDARSRVEALDLSPKVLFFASMPDGAPRAAGDETAAAGVIEILGGTNVFAGRTGYKALSLEAAVAADPDVILVMSHHAEREGGVDAVRRHPALSLTSAARNGQVFPVDQYAVMQFGPRTPGAVADLAARIAETTSE